MKLAANGAEIELDASPTRNLLDTLRHGLAPTGAKPVCTVGRCGACVVWFGGALANACLVPAFRLTGRAVTTVEGVPADNDISRALGGRAGSSAATARRA